jgi:hypothetical protein
MKYSILYFILIFSLLACQKEQRLVYRMEGKWTVRSAELANYGTLEPDLVFDFDWCKTRFDEFCDYSLYDFNLNYTVLGSYQISEDGNQLVLSWAEFGQAYFETFEIERLNNRWLKLVNTNPNSNFYRRMELRHID